MSRAIDNCTAKRTTQSRLRNGSTRTSLISKNSSKTWYWCSITSSGGNSTVQSLTITSPQRASLKSFLSRCRRKRRSSMQDGGLKPWPPSGTALQPASLSSSTDKTSCSDWLAPKRSRRPGLGLRFHTKKSSCKSMNGSWPIGTSERSTARLVTS